MKKNDLKNMTISEYLDDISEFTSELISYQNELILEKLKSGEKLDELELYFICSQLKLLIKENKYE